MSKDNINASEITQYNQHNFDLRGITSGSIKTTCIFCTSTRGNPKDRSVSIDFDKEIPVYYCHHCNKTGPLHKYGENGTPPFQTLSLSEYFQQRSISQTTLDKMHITMEGNWIKFPYFQDGKQVNTKSRSLDKQFMFEKGKDIIPYNIDSINNAEALIITEGEIDALTFIECGFDNVISVPTGANVNLKYLDPFDLSSIKTFYIASDNDEKGHQLAEALFKRFGIDKCLRVDYSNCKDINELIGTHGKQAVKDAIQNATNPKYKELLKRIEQRHFNTKTQFEDMIPLVYFEGKKAISLGNFSTVTGKQKAGKGFTLSLIVNGFLNGDPQYDTIGSGALDRKRVVYIDTEQAGFHAKRLINTVKKLDGNEHLIDGYWLRGFAPEEIILAADQIIKKYSGEASLFIIDGVKDMSSKGINDEEESTKIAVKLLDWTQRYNIHIITVIHQNKKDGNATGYLGGDMVKKGELTLSVTKDKKKLTHHIYPEDTRDANVKDMYFRINENVVPEFIDGQQQDNGDRTKLRPDHLSEDAHRQMISNIWNESTIFTTKDLIPQIKYELMKLNWDIGTNIARYFITYWMQKGWIKNNTDRRSNQYSII